MKKTGDNREETKCVFPRCRNESMLIWLGKPVCDEHWNWICEHGKQKAFARLNMSEPEYKEEKKDPIQVVVEHKEEELNPVLKKTKQPYTEEIDKQLLELKSKNLPIGEIAKTIGRSYASTMYRLRHLGGKSGVIVS